MSVINGLLGCVSPPGSETPSGEGDTDPDTDSEPEIAIDIDTALSVLASERRRVAIRFAIDETDGVFDIAELAQSIATEEYGPEYTSDERKRVYVALHQNHLPALVDAGVVTRVDDGGAQTFRVTDAARPLYALLETATAQLGGEE